MEKFAKKLRDFLRLNYDDVRQVKVEKALDWMGDESLFIWILVSDDLTEKDLSWDRIQPLIEATRDESLVHYREFYPYVKVKRQQEWRQMAAT